MTDFGLRIGPKATPSQEEKPLYDHRAWTRPGYQPPLRLVSPKKPRHSDDWSMDNRSSALAEGHPSLLVRMGLDIPSSSRSVNTDYGNRRMSGQHFSARDGGDTTEEPRTGTVTLGMHHLESLSTHDNATEMDSLISDNLSNDESLEEMNICAPHGPLTSKGLSSPSGGNGRHPPWGPRIRHTSNAHRPNNSATVFSGVSNSTMDTTESPGIPWSRLPLKDRIAPLVRQNLELRISQNPFAPNSNQDEQHLDDESLDAILTPELCNSIIDSLSATRSQLVEKSATQLSQQTPQSVISEQDKDQHIGIPAEPPTTSLISIPLHLVNPQTPLAAATLGQMPVMPVPPSHQQPTNANREQVPSSAATCPSNQQIISAGSAAPLPDVQGEAIPILLSAAFFNRAPALPTPPNTTSSFGTTFDSHMKHGRNDDSPSPRPRPHKRLRSRSPSTSSSRQYSKDKDRSRGRDSGRDASDSSSARHDLLPSPSVSSSPHKRRRQKSPNAARRSESPSARSGRLASPSRTRRSRSPRREDPSYLNSHHQSSSLHRQNTSPSRSHDLGMSLDRSSRPFIKEPSELRLSPTSHKSSYKRSHLGNTRERYVTTYERERRAREAKKNEEREREASPERQSVVTLNKNQERQQSNVSMGENTVDGRASLPRTPSEPTSQSSTLLMSSTSAASFADRSTALRETNLDTLSKLASEGAQSSSSAHVVTGEKEASANGDVNLLSMSVDTEIQARAQAKEAEDHSWKPFSDIPGIWFFRQGSSEPDVLEETFEVTEEIVQKWQSKPSQENMGKSVPTSASFVEALSEPKSASLPMFSWNLMCVATDSANSLQETLNKFVTAKELLQELTSIQCQWPTNGQLIIEINPDHDIGGAFYANDLDSALPCMEVKGHIHSAAPNVVRLIQLGDMSKYVFILFAKPILEPANSHDILSLEDLQMMLWKSRTGKELALMTGSVIVQKL